MDESNNNQPQFDNGAQSTDPQVSDQAPPVVSNDGLNDVKSRALDELLNLLPETHNFSAQRRFELYVEKVHESGDKASAESALDAALAIEEKDERADALAELIDEIDYYNLS